jgi:four helix bundle protein
VSLLQLKRKGNFLFDKETRMGPQGYQTLEVWQKAMDLVTECYQLTEVFPPHEIQGLSSQLRRAAVSVPANIAEGQGRNHAREFLYHLSVAYASLMAAETHLHIAGRLKFVDPSALRASLQRTAEIGRLINSLMQSINQTLAHS